MLCAIVLQCSLQAMIITENTVGAGVIIAAVGVGFVGKDSEPRFVFPAIACAALGSYLWLSRYTPQAKHRIVKALEDNAANNLLVKRYGEMALEIEDEIKKEMPSLASTPILCEKCKLYNEKLVTEIFNGKFAKLIKKEYPSIPNVKPFPLITAANELIPAKADLKIAGEMLDALVPYINEKTDLKLWQEHKNLNDRLQRFIINAKNAHARFDDMDEYKSDLLLFQKFELDQANLKLAKENLAANQKIANAAEINAYAASEQSQSVRSYLSLRWWIDLCSWLLGGRNK